MIVRTVSLGLALSVFLSACSDDKGTTTSGGTTGTGTATDGGTGTATDGGATDGGATGGMSTGGGGGIEADCLAGAAAEAKVVEYICGCAVESGAYPDVATCLKTLGTSPQDSACYCDVSAMDPANAAFFACDLEAKEKFAVCYMSTKCSDDVAQDVCLDAYTDVDCGSLSKATSGKLELNCEMAPPAMCMSGETIPPSWVCDMEKDCMDGSDEVDCFFTCGDGMMIPKEFKCDGGKDCADGSDEANCP